jgi:hypothetical protein
MRVITDHLAVNGTINTVMQFHNDELLMAFSLGMHRVQFVQQISGMWPWHFLTQPFGHLRSVDH